MFPLAIFTAPLMKDHIRLVRDEVMGYAGRIACCMASIDDMTVFAVFFVVRSSLQQRPFSLKGYYRTGTFRWDMKSGFWVVSGIPTPAIQYCALPTPVQ